MPTARRKRRSLMRICPPPCVWPPLASAASPYAPFGGARLEGSCCWRGAPAPRQGVPELALATARLLAAQEKPLTSAESGEENFFDSILKISLQSFSIDLFFFLETMCFNMHEPTIFN